MSGAAIMTLALGNAGGGGGSGGGDVVPDAISFTNINGAFYAMTNTQTISGINTPVTLEIDFTGSGFCSALLNGSTVFMSSGANITVNDGDTIAFSAAAPGPSAVSGGFTIKNVSHSNDVLATFSYAVSGNPGFFI